MADDKVKQSDVSEDAEVKTKEKEKESEVKVKDKDKDKSKDAKAKDKKKKAKEPGKVRRWFKDFFSELKKVTWPTFTQVLKRLGTVLVVTLCFLLVMLAFDSLLGWLYQLLLGGLSEESVTMLAAAVGGGGVL